MNVCKRCYHTWKKRASKTPSICPKCKSKLWNTAKKQNNPDVSTLEALNAVTSKIVNISSSISDSNEDNNDLLLSLFPQVLLVVSNSISGAERSFIDEGDLHKAIKYLEACKSLVVCDVLPIEFCYSINRIISDMMRDNMIMDKHKIKSDKSEYDLCNELVNNWKKTSIGKLYNFSEMEHILPDGDRIDILAYEKETNRPVIIEAKRNKVDGYKQLRSYAIFFDNPILINVSEEPVTIQKYGIIYKLFSNL